MSLRLTPRVVEYHRAPDDRQALACVARQHAVFLTAIRMSQSDAPELSRLQARWHLAAVVGLTLIMLVLVELHVHGVNGPFYGMVTWRRYPAVRAYLLTLACAIPTIAAIALWPRTRRFKAALLLLPMVGVMGAKLVFADLRSAPGPHLCFISDAVQHPLAVSYYTDASALSGFHGWLADFPVIMPMLNLHSKTKAPGMILYYMAFIKTLGHSQQTALTAGIVLGAICTLAIPACYWFLLTLLEDKGIAFLGALLPVAVSRLCALFSGVRSSVRDSVLPDCDHVDQGAKAEPYDVGRRYRRDHGGDPGHLI